MKQYRQAVSALVLKHSGVCSPDGCTTLQSVLLVHKPRKRDAWQIPQGGIEAGETQAQAAIRELKEETGLDLSGDVHISTHTYLYDFPPEFVRRYNPVNAGQQLCFVVMEAAPDVQVTVDQHEVDSYLWVLIEQLPTYIERAEYLDVIKRVLADYKHEKEGSSSSSRVG